LIDAGTNTTEAIQIGDQKTFSDPRWVGEGTIVAAIGLTHSDTVAIIDVSQPRQSKVKEVLWRKASGPDVGPTYPIYSPATRRCVFVGEESTRSALYSVELGKAEPAKRLGPEEYDPQITGLEYSPDGNFVLYSAQGRIQTPRDLAPMRPKSAKKSLRSRQQNSRRPS
jgi:hypothetical protein